MNGSPRRLGPQADAKGLETGAIGDPGGAKPESPILPARDFTTISTSLLPTSASEIGRNADRRPGFSQRRCDVCVIRFALPRPILSLVEGEFVRCIPARYPRRLPPDLRPHRRAADRRLSHTSSQIFFANSDSYAILSIFREFRLNTIDAVRRSCGRYTLIHRPSLRRVRMIGGGRRPRISPLSFPGNLALSVDASGHRLAI